MPYHCIIGYKQVLKICVESNAQKRQNNSYFGVNIVGDHACCPNENQSNVKRFPRLSSEY